MGIWGVWVLASHLWSTSKAVESFFNTAILSKNLLRIFTDSLHLRGADLLPCCAKI
jgi:hypothetical protein